MDYDYLVKLSIGLWRHFDFRHRDRTAKRILLIYCLFHLFFIVDV